MSPLARNALSQSYCKSITKAHINSLLEPCFLPNRMRLSFSLPSSKHGISFELTEAVLAGGPEEDVRPRFRRGGVGVHGVDEGLEAVRVVALRVHQGDVEVEARRRRPRRPLQADEDGGARPLLVGQQPDLLGLVHAGAVGEDDGDLDDARGGVAAAFYIRR